MSRRLVVMAVVTGMLGLAPAGSAAEPTLAVANCASPTIMGTSGNDRLVGTAGDDIIQGLAGNDVIDGKGGNDEICGGLGRDMISGGGGDDIIRGGPGNDTLSGNFGADTISGGRGNDTLSGGNGPDTLNGDEGKDALAGNGGRDQLHGGDDDDVLEGNKGFDKLWGELGNDTLQGGYGSDRLRGGYGPDWIEGGVGNDILIGGPDSDVLYGQRDNDIHRGLGGNETIRAGLGDDLLDGGAGDDLLDPGAGADVCFDDGSSVPCPSVLGNAYGGNAVILDNQQPLTLNPVIIGSDSAGNLLIDQGLSAGAFSVDPMTRQVVPELLVAMPSVANGGLVVNQDGSMTVHYDIRPDAVWSDGIPVSGADFQFTLDTIIGLGPDADPSLTIQPYDQIVASSFGDKTFEFTMNEASVRYELLFELVIPKHAVEGTDLFNDWNTVAWPSAGPFVFGDWIPDISMTLVRNDNYWKQDPVTGQQLPYLDSITLKFDPVSFEGQRAAFIGREADVYGPSLTAILEELAPFEAAGAKVDTYASGVWEHLNFQFGPGRLARNPNSANENLNFRKGVAHAVDRTAITEDVLDGRLDPINSIVNVAQPGLSPDPWDQYDYNPTLATSYFDAAKAELGVAELDVVFTTTDSNDMRVRTAQLLGPMFEAVGVNYEVQLEDFNLFIFTTIVDGTWDMGMFAWLPGTGRAGPISLLDIFDPEQSPADGFNHYRYGTADSSVNDAASTRFAEIRDLVYESIDSAVIEPLIVEAEAILADNVIAVPLYQRPRVLLHWDDEVGGVVPNDSRQMFTWNIEQWHRVDR